MFTVTAKCKVIYNGRLYYAGEPFDIQDADAEEMKQYGTVAKKAGHKDNEQSEGKSERKPRKKIEKVEVGDENDGQSDTNNDTTLDRGDE